MILRVYSAAVTVALIWLVVTSGNWKAVLLPDNARFEPQLNSVQTISNVPVRSQEQRTESPSVARALAPQPSNSDPVVENFTEDKEYIGLCYSECPRMIQNAKAVAKEQVKQIAKTYPLNTAERATLEREQFHEQVSYIMPSDGKAYALLTATGTDSYERAFGAERAAEIRAHEQTISDTLVTEMDLSLAEYLARELQLPSEKKDRLRSALLDNKRQDETYIIGLAQATGMSEEQEKQYRIAKSKWSDDNDIEKYIESQGGLAALSQEERYKDAAGTESPDLEIIKNKLVLRELESTLPTEVQKRLAELIDQQFHGIPPEPDDATDNAPS